MKSVNPLTAERHPARKLSVLLSLMLTLSLLAPSIPAEALEKIDGYRDFKFGMTKNEIKEVGERVCRDITVPPYVIPPSARGCFDGSIPEIIFLVSQSDPLFEIQLKFGGDGSFDTLRKKANSIQPGIEGKFGKPVYIEESNSGPTVWYADFNVALDVSYTRGLSVVYFSEKSEAPKKARIRAFDSNKTPKF